MVVAAGIRTLLGPSRVSDSWKAAPRHCPGEGPESWEQAWKQAWYVDPLLSPMREVGTPGVAVALGEDQACTES